MVYIFSKWGWCFSIGAIEESPPSMHYVFAPSLYICLITSTKAAEMGWAISFPQLNYCHQWQFSLQSIILYSLYNQVMGYMRLNNITLSRDNRTSLLLINIKYVIYCQITDTSIPMVVANILLLLSPRTLFPHFHMHISRGILDVKHIAGWVITHFQLYSNICWSLTLY